MKHRHVWLGILFCLALPSLWPARLEAQDRQPYTLEQLKRMVETGVFPDGRIIALVRESCLGFTLDAEARNELRVAGASEGLIANLRQMCVHLRLVVTTIVVTPPELELPAGESLPLRAQGLGADSSRIPNVTFEWSSEDTIVADVSMAGMVSGKTPGLTRIRVSTADGPSTLVPVRVVRAAAAVGATPVDSIAAERRSGKSAGTAAALGFIVPGGGEFYSGNTAKGVVVLLGAAGALAAGYLIISEDIVAETRTPPASGPVCDTTAGSCSYSGVVTAIEKEETRQIVIGAAVAGAFWLYGLVDGIRTARKSSPAGLAAAERVGNARMRLTVLPPDGLAISGDGDLLLTLIRLQP